MSLIKRLYNRIFHKKPTLFEHVKYMTTIVLTAGAIVLFWRGVWGMLDLYLFPEDPFFSYLVSIVLGLFILWVDDGKLTEMEHEHGL